MRTIKRRIKPYYKNSFGRLYHGNCVNVMNRLKDKVDLVITSPPYDEMRDYKGFKFEFKKIARSLKSILKPGGIIVWVVGDQTKEYSESGNSFRQALYFKRIGLHLYDTMIYQKSVPTPMNTRRYYQEFEFMFVLSKGKPNTFNPIKTISKTYKPGQRHDHSKRKSAAASDKGAMIRDKSIFHAKRKKIIGNIWKYHAGAGTKDKIAFKHPAIYPEKLVYDHVISWSNPGDLILDPMAGSGTTCKVSQVLKRNWIGIELTKEYCDIIKCRMENLNSVNTLF